MEYIIIAINIYIISIIGARLKIIQLYRDEWTNTNPNSTDLLMVFAPIFNTVLAIMYIFHKIPSKWKNTKNTNKFFGLKER